MSHEEYLEQLFGVSDEPLTVEEYNERQMYNLENGDSEPDFNRVSYL